MPCEKYQDALIDLAAANVEPAGDLRVHLAGCVMCRAHLEQQQSLIASIDSGIRQTANVPLPPALIHRFEAHLAQQAPPKPALYFKSTYAVAALATAAVLLVVPRLRMHDANQQQGVVSVAVQQRNATKSEAVVPAIPRRFAPRFTRHKPTSQPPERSEPEVLVPPDERIAFERFLADLNGREDLAIALVKPMREQRQTHTAPVAMPVPVEVPDLETIALTVQPISEIADR
jgi:hypothetical protein